MRLSALIRQVERDPVDAAEYSIYLAEPDTAPGDGIDAFVIGIGDVQVDYDKNKIRIRPAHQDDPDASGSPLLLLSLLLERIPPMPIGEEDDFELLVEQPLNRESGSSAFRTWAPVEALHLGQASTEAWLLLRPAAEFANDVLPS